MIEFLERKGILTFHPSIKTHKQKIYALTLATLDVILVTGIMFVLMKYIVSF